MPSTRHPSLTRLQERLNDGPPRRRWRTSVGTSASADLGLRLVVLVAGLVLVAAGAALWLFSTLLTAPLLLAGLWVLSWEFAWARWLLHRFTMWVRPFVGRVRRRPARWTVLTAGGIASGAAGYWAFMVLGPL
ncbi:hypothetical protein [Nocardioides aquaticus]|uniref:hypothetical protein n=1 Tax=Nocardioides aquaticus TaxID=160826 RepID=UPI001BD4975A|nr:hypothetical protein [Nocardioides aquaticus]